MINTYYQLIDALKKEASKEPNCNLQLYPDIYELNSRPDINYWVFAITPNIITADENTITANLNIFYVDRLDDTNNNHLSIQSSGIQALRNIIFRFNHNNPELDIEFPNQYNCFYQKFADSCSGVYMNVSITFPSNVCYIGEEN